MKINEMLLGASVIALSMAGTMLPSVAWAQADESNASAQEESEDDGDTIVITGRRQALQSADERKKNAGAILDAVVADDAGKLPDNSITEVLQRVSGVSIVRFAALGDPDHFSVEGSGIQVRGLSGVASRLNGREIFSANSGRSLLWGDVTPELMSAVDVYKSTSADMIEGGTGGTVDLRTKLPFDYDYGMNFAGSGELSYGDLAKETDYSASGLISGKWDTDIGDIGFLIDGAYSQFSSNSDFFRMETYYRTRLNNSDYFIPGGYDYGEQDFQRKREGIYAAGQWAPNDELLFTGIFFQSRYQNESHEYGSFVTSQTLAVDPSTSTFDDQGGLLQSDAVFQRDTATFAPSGATITSGGNMGVALSDSKTQDMSLAFDWSPANSRWQVQGAYQRIVSTADADSVSIFRDVQFPTSFGLDLTGDLPQVSLPANFQESLDDPANYVWSASMPHGENNRGTLDAFNIDASVLIGDGFFRSAKFGARWSDRSERDFNNGYAWSALGRGWNGDPQMTFANAAPGDVSQHLFEDFFRGDATLPGELLFPSLDLARRFASDPSYRDVLHSSPPDNFCGAPFASDLWFNCSPSGPAPSTGYGGADYRQPGFVLPQDRTDYSTKQVAGYGLVRFGHNLDNGAEIEGNAGLRVVEVENTSEGFFQQFSTTFVRDGQTYTLADRSENRVDGAKFTKYLPSVNVSYWPTEEIVFRGAYNITMDNASFNALRASGDLGVATTTNPNSTPSNNLPGVFTNYTTTSGNPRLEPTTSNNFDFSAEWYPRAGTTFHLAAFYKDLENLPIYSATQQPVTVYFDDGTSEEAFATATDVRNAEENAKVRGVEVGGRIFFDNAPGLWSGFGVEANYTYIDSENPGDLYRDIDGVTRNDAPLQGLSEHNYNATLLYEREPFSARIAYSWRSKYLQSTNANGTNVTYTYFSEPGVSTSIATALPVYGDAYGTLDAGVQYRVNDNVSLFLQGTNLTNSTEETLMGGYPDGKLYTRSWFQSDRRVNAGVNLSF
ncbi:TonB-dependent receptor [Parvularcula flava]|uniref:TonB-dependent receptor n=1 Tax=Aquisalinus luteolus TaxID=1566827 RepID=A0A8J3A4H2_9PROT|nr:TonB-dependent receptor [Aquisalinus luteolus]NHK29656.1 TonB-dependent receptor [Aquisalinus luteolus]GGI02196.1 TonB-dependent receptor [Aquisalinus luteolus]